METPAKLVLFCLDGQKYALNLTVVERAIRSVETTPVPQAPSFVLGVINMGGAIVPVLDTRTLLGLPKREIELNDHLIVARAGKLQVALLADEATGVVDCKAQDFIAAEDVYPALGEMEGLVKLDDGIIFIYDLHKFLSRENLSDVGNTLMSVPPDVLSDEAVQ